MAKNVIIRQLEVISKIIFHILKVRAPHTLQHIQNVPALSLMIAKAVKKKNKKPYFSKEDLLNIDIAAQLHDCGKTTSPDYLLIKSTKLECLHNRIHEIRNRFEILRRDAEISCLKKIISNPQNASKAKAKLKETIKELEDEFAYIAYINLGETAITEKDIQKIKKIGQKTFKRHFNRLQGLSWNECQKLSDEQQEQYAQSGYEFLLQDNPEDTFLDIPTGEIHNLSIQKGTLSAEEREKIEEHVLETENIFNLIPLSNKHKCISEYASQHHERPNGKGYPHGLEDKDLSLAGKIITLADIFEALTSSERPYKSPKKLSDSLRVLQEMKNDGQIDEDIYHLFLKKKIFLKYAQKYLKPEQIDNIDIKEYF